MNNIDTLPEENVQPSESPKYKTVRQSTFLIIPFALNTNYVDAKQNLSSATYTKRDGNVGEIWREKSFSRQRLFSHISQLISSSSIDSNEAIGTRLVLEEPARTSLNLPNNRKTLLSFTPAKENFLFSLGEIELYLFETQVGFIVFDIVYQDGQPLENMILSNYYLKKIYRYRDELRYSKKIGRDQYEEVSVSFCDLIETFLSMVEVETYFEDVHKRPSHALVYSSALLGSDYKAEGHNKQILKYLFQMRKSFKETYAAAPAEFELEQNDEITQLFENSFWGVSLEGAAHIAYLQNNNADQFFKEQHATNIREVYFYLYILALHQHYALQYFSILASKLPATLDVYLENKNIAQKYVESLKSRMVFFKLRCAFKQVSHISHQTSLYEMFRRSLRIEELMEELQLEIEALSTITEMEQSRRSKKIENVIFLVTTVFVIISTLNDSMGIISFIDTSNWPANKPFTPWIAGPLWTLIIGGSFYIIVKLLIKR